MKKLTILPLLFFFSCAVNKNQNSSKDNKNTIVAMEKTLDDWHKAAAEAQFDTYFNLMDADAVFVGTDPKEVWNKDDFMAFAKPYFDKGKAWKFTKISRNIHLSNNQKIAWFDELLNTWMGTCRGSGVLVYKNKHWLIKHYVLSLSVPNEKMSSVMKVLND